MKQNTFLYRQGSMADLEQLQQQAILSYRQFSQVLSADNWSILNGYLNDKENFVSLLSKGKCFACLDEGQVVGAAYIIPSGNAWDVFKAEWSYIRMVGVDPNYRGYGIAKNLTKLCIDYAKQNGEQTIALHTSEFMNAARHIYENLGFKILNEIAPRYGKKYWLYTFELGQNSQ